MDGFAVGDLVRIERDEKLYPSQGTWPRYRGKPGVVAILNVEDREIGVEVGAAQARYRGNVDANGAPRLQYAHEQVAWFKPHELRLVTPRQ